MNLPHGRTSVSIDRLKAARLPTISMPSDKPHITNPTNTTERPVTPSTERRVSRNLHLPNKTVSDDVENPLLQTITNE